MITLKVGLYFPGEDTEGPTAEKEFQFTTYRDAQEAQRILSWIGEEQSADPDPLITSEIK